MQLKSTKAWQCFKGWVVTTRTWSCPGYCPPPVNVQRFSQCFLVLSRMPKIPCEKTFWTQYPRNVQKMCFLFKLALFWEVGIWKARARGNVCWSQIWGFDQMQVKCRHHSTLSNFAGRPIENALHFYFVQFASHCAENTTPGNPWLLLFYIPEWRASIALQQLKADKFQTAICLIFSKIWTYLSTIDVPQSITLGQRMSKGTVAGVKIFDQ